MTKQRRLLLLVAAALLLLLNIWRWWPSASRTNSGVERTPARNAVRVEDFVIQGVSGGRLPPVRRDPFQAKRPVAVKPIVVKPPEPPPKSPEELDREAAQAEYAALRCLAVVFRDGRGQALLAAGQQNFHVSVGERVGGRFVVNLIETDGVRVQDPTTGIGGKISLSGGSP